MPFIFNIHHEYFMFPHTKQRNVGKIRDKNDISSTLAFHQSGAYAYCHFKFTMLSLYPVFQLYICDILKILYVLCDHYHSMQHRSTTYQ